MLFFLGVESDGNKRRAEKVPSILEWVESLLPMHRNKEKQKTRSDISILKHGIISILKIHILLPLYYYIFILYLVSLE